jgi:ATP-binding cassette subfamily F protein 3
MLRDDQSPLWHLSKISPGVREQELRNFLGGFNFPGDMATGSIEHFSGGEKARLALALIVWQRPNLLLLDEPTNHLDLETREALTVALAQFEGTLVLVSHDRHLLRATTDQFMIVADGRLQPFDGDLDDYKEWLLKSKLGAAEEKKVAERNPPPSKENKQEKKQEKKPLNRKPIEARIKRLEEQMAKLNAKKSSIDAQLANPSVYQDRRKVEPILLDQAYVAKELAQLESEWLQKQDELERVGEEGA